MENWSGFRRRSTGAAGLNSAKALLHLLPWRIQGLTGAWAADGALRKHVRNDSPTELHILRLQINSPRVRAGRMR